MNKKCKHCGGNISERNPSGYCDHLFYPENCDVCNGSKTMNNNWEEKFNNEFVKTNKMQRCIQDSVKQFISKTLKDREEEIRNEVLNEFAEFCHDNYGGCYEDNGVWKYSYTEEICELVIKFKQS